MGSDILDRIAVAGKAMGEGDQVVMRLALKIGLKYLARIDYDLEGAVIEKADGGAASLGKAMISAAVDSRSPSASKSAQNAS